MRYLMGIGLLLALLMGPAYSQQQNQDWGPNDKDLAQKAEASRRAKDLERDYNEVTKKNGAHYESINRSLAIRQILGRCRQAEAIA